MPTLVEIPMVAAARPMRYALPLLLGIAMTFAVRGYQFGGGNHSVYLIAPLREVHPELLANDWWTTHTLQYHVVYTKLSAALMRAGIIEPAFLAFYLALVGLLHVGWLRLVLALGLDARAYVLSVLLYYLSAGGTGLGAYQFFQDISFLPGNVANVAMFWGLAFWVERRWRSAAIALGIAGLFHLNHALVGLMFWPAAVAFDRWIARRPLAEDRAAIGRPSVRTHAILGLAIIAIFSLPNVLPAARAALAHVPKMPLKEFVDLYVHLRHPHHYDPLVWPAALWLSFLWPMPLAVLAFRARRSDPAWSLAAFVLVFFVALQLVAMVFAGILFVSEPLIQMSLFRFSIYPKLLSCVAAAGLVLQPQVLRRASVRLAMAAIPIVTVAVLLVVGLLYPSSTAGAFVAANVRPLFALVLVLAAGIAFACRLPLPDRPIYRIAPLALLALLIGFRNSLGLHINLKDDAGRDYLDACAWARDHTPVDALFVVPPNEQLFRFHARRAIVVNFKNVPQLSSEMREWRERLEAILGEPLATLPKRFDLAHVAIAERYAALSPDHLSGVAQRYGARFVLAARALPGRRAVFESGSFHLYDLNNPADGW